MEPAITIHIIAREGRAGRRLARLFDAAGHPVRLLGHLEGDVEGPPSPAPHIHVIVGLEAPVAEPLARASHDEAGNPVVVMAADLSEDAVVALLEAGADEVLPVDTSPAELIARLHALARRVNTPTQALWWGGVSFDPGQPQIQRGEEVIPLTVTEHRMLAFLARRAAAGGRSPRAAARGVGA